MWSGRTAAGRWARAPSTRSCMWTPSAATPSPSASAPPAPARRISPRRWRWPRFFGKQVGRIILTRPAVEAGESLGFLPGTVSEKVDPYFRPLFDALYDMIDGEKLAALIEKGEIEVAPLAFMRGRTLNDSFIILDEAQNTSPEQMKMFLTRLGFGRKMVVTGDVTQIDLPHSRTSGLVTVPEVLDDIDDIAIVHFDGHDVVRHKLVQRIVNAYGARRRDRGGAGAAPCGAGRAGRGGLVNLVEVVNGTRTVVDEETRRAARGQRAREGGRIRRRGRRDLRRRAPHPRPQSRAPRQGRGHRRAQLSTRGRKNATRRATPPARRRRRGPSSQPR